MKYNTENQYNQNSLSPSSHILSMAGLSLLISSFKMVFISVILVLLFLFLFSLAFSFDSFLVSLC